MTGYIYIIKNTNNNKVYIGQTSRTIQARWNQHINAALRGEEQGIILYNAMRKYGIESFYIAKLEECDIAQLDEREIYWISYYNSITPNGYNIRAGGDDSGRKEVYKLDKEGNIIECYGSAMAAAEVNGLDLSGLTKVCRGESYSLGGFKWSYADTYNQEERQQHKIIQRNVKICQVDINSAKLIKIWNSITEAANTLHIQQSDISRCMLKEYNTAGGFIWCKPEELDTVKPYKREKTIQQFDKEYNLIQTWNSAKDAAESLGKDASNIRAAARGQRKTAYGYIWKYKE